MTMWTEADEYDFQMKLKDKELLELAAKAAGYKCYRLGNESIFQIKANPISFESWKNWNPLADDSDAFRLAVKLNIDVMPNPERVTTENPDGKFFVVDDEYYGNDPYAATRRAIVRAAAEIGKTGGNDVN